MPFVTPEQITAFITRWSSSGAAERANYQMFLSELCDIIGVPRPDPTAADTTKNLYVFDRAITRTHPDGSSTAQKIAELLGVRRLRRHLRAQSIGLNPPAS